MEVFFDGSDPEWMQALKKGTSPDGDPSETRALALKRGPKPTKPKSSKVGTGAKRE
jgi:hypothetical protein